MNRANKLSRPCGLTIPDAYASFTVLRTLRAGRLRQSSCAAGGACRAALSFALGPWDACLFSLLPGFVALSVNLKSVRCTGRPGCARPSRVKRFRAPCSPVRCSLRCAPHAASARALDLHPFCTALQDHRRRTQEKRRQASPGPAAHHNKSGRARNLGIRSTWKTSEPSPCRPHAGPTHTKGFI